MPSRFRLASTDLEDVEARRADVVRAVTAAERALGRDQYPVAAAGDRLPEDLFRLSLRIDIGAVEHRQAGVETDVDQACRLLDVARAPGLEEVRRRRTSRCRT